MPKARNMIIDGYRKGTKLQMDNLGLFYIFNGRNPVDDIYIESYQILTEETTKNVTSTVGRGLVGSALFGVVGSTAALTGKEDKIYTIQVVWDDYGEKEKRGYSIFELDSIFYKMFMMKCTRTSERQKQIEESRFKPIIKPQSKKQPSKYIYNYLKWMEYNKITDNGGVNQTYLNALDDNPETNPILDCCRSINPEWEEYIKQQKQESQSQPQQNQITNNTDTSNIKSKLKELKSIYEEDLITEEEYESKKKEILDKL